MLCIYTGLQPSSPALWPPAEAGVYNALFHSFAKEIIAVSAFMVDADRLNARSQAAFDHCPAIHRCGRRAPMFSRRVWATVRVHADGLVTRHARRAAPLKGGDPMTNRDHLAHSVGFEPTDVSAYGFQDRCHKPLDQLCMNPRITRPGTALVFLRPRTSPPTSGGGAVKSRSPRPLIPLPEESPPGSSTCKGFSSTPRILSL